MAEVFLARSVSSGLGKLVALKRTLPDYLDSEEMGQMFLDEMKVAACLNHRNIVQTFDFGMVQSQAYFVMEFIHGVSLRELVAYLRDENEYLDLAMVFYIIKEVAEGLDYAIRVQDPSSGRPLSLVHRDLSPHNIMITYNGEVKIIDFGVAKASATQQTVHGVVKGKIAYMSPEQNRGEPIDQRSDLFSLGVVFWELLTNRRFFSGQSVHEVKERVREYRIENLNFSESQRVEFARDILAKLLHHKVQKRYQGPRDLIKDLNFVLNRVYPFFSSEELAARLKNDYFQKKFLDSTEDFKVMQASKLEPELLVEKTVLTAKSQKPKLPPQRLASVNRFRVVSENARSLNLGRLFFVLVLLFMGCLAAVAYRVYFPNYNWDLSSYKQVVQEVSEKVTGEIRGQQKVVAVIPQPVTVVFSSNPPGASMLIDGQSHSLNIPISVMMELSKNYQIDVYKEGYIPRSFKFLPTKSTQYEIKLERFPFLRVAANQEEFKVKKTTRRKRKK
ncbi:protein kinase [Bdellovibrio bacteriovorus]|uniref:protein kinase domain-containing protein n=2 Tax=Bdellovibrio TaxID=958 RepID=UPI0035A8F4C1